MAEQLRAPVRPSQRSFPLFAWLRGYDRSWLRPDLIAALTTWALVVPQSIAYAQIAGLPPQAGLFTAFAALLGYAALGTCRQLVVSPASAPAALSASIVGAMALGDPARFASLSSALALLVGIAFIAYGWLKLGFVSQFITSSVQTGLMFGLGMTIITGQLPKLLGTPAVSGTFIEEAAGVVRGLGAVNLWTLALGGISLLALIIGKRVAPNAPLALIVVVVSVLVVTLLNLDAHGVAVMGNVGTQIPTLKLPIFTLQDLGTLMPGVLAISLIGYAESDTVAEQFAAEHRYDIKPNQELVALGAANMASGLFQGFIVAGGASQSATNDRAGARSQLSGLIVSGLIFLTAALLMPLFANLAQAVLGAIVISAVLGFFNVPALRRIFRLRPDEFWLAMVALFGVLILGMLPGLLLAVFLSAGVLLVRASQPKLHELGWLADKGVMVNIGRYPEAQQIPQLLIVRLSAPLFADNAQAARNLVRDKVRAQTSPPRVVLFDLETATNLDVESIDKLEQMHRELGEEHIQLWLAQLHDAAADMAVRSGLVEIVGRNHIFATVGGAVDAFTRQNEQARATEAVRTASFAERN